jgi:hypothetical protein
MQKFVIGPGIGGAYVTWRGVKALVFEHGEGLDPLYGYGTEDLLYESHGQVCIHDKFSPLLTEWFKLFHETDPDTALENIEPDDSINLGYCTEHIREMLLPFIESLEGDYEQFDKENDGNELRIVEVPDGYDCRVSKEDETGCESVQECGKMWLAPKDDVWKDILSVRKFCKQFEQEPAKEGYVYTYKDVQIAFMDGYGIAQRKNGEVMFLKKNTYYRATDDHGTVCYDIEGDRPNKFSEPKITRSPEEMKAYFELLHLIELSGKK